MSIYYCSKCHCLSLLAKNKLSTFLLGLLFKVCSSVFEETVGLKNGTCACVPHVGSLVVEDYVNTEWKIPQEDMDSLFCQPLNLNQKLHVNVLKITL